MVGLDPKSARLLKDLFREFVDRGGTVLMSTHTLEIAEAMCDRIAHHPAAARSSRAARWPSCARQHAAGDASLEDLFLRLTGGAPCASWSRCSSAEAVIRQPSLAARPPAQVAHRAGTRLREERDRAGRGKLLLLALVGGASGRRCSASLYRVLQLRPERRGDRHAACPGRCWAHPPHLRVDPAAVERHHGAVDASSWRRTSTCSSPRRSTGCASTSPSSARRCCTPRGWWR